MTTDIYLIHTLTNLHVGKGEAQYGIIDKEVQRDTLGGKLPVIHASGLKGAYRELFNQQVFPKPSPTLDHPTVVEIFGSEAGNSVSQKPGSYHFLDARLLTLPVRSSLRPYYLGTSFRILKELTETLKTFGDTTSNYFQALTALLDLESQLGENDNVLVFHGSPDSIIEDKIYNIKAVANFAPNPTLQTALNTLFEDYNLLAIFKGDAFDNVANKLPVIARNYLENGTSKNLWYEEVVPHKSRFYFSIIKPTNDTKFETGLAKVKHIAQIGGNATVGYGFCKISQLLSI